jgi:error-prone DNA polymerase
LILAGGFDAMHGEVSRRDLLWHLINLRESAAPVSGNQMVFAASRWTPTPTGLKPMSMAERVKHEVEVLGLDLSAHVISFYAPMLRDLGVLASVRMLDVRSQARVLVAGVKVATQTPPIRSGKRVAFVTLDDSTGPVDVTFFEDAQEQYAPTLFHSWLLLARGEIRRTGPRGVSVRADGCWELGAVWEVWREGGVTAVHEMLARQPYDDSEPVVATAAWEHASGFRQSPYAQAR